MVESAERGRPELLMVEYDGGFWCGRFSLSQDGIVYSATCELAYAPLMVRYAQEAGILGRVDMESRWMHRLRGPRVPAERVAPGIGGIPMRLGSVRHL